MRLFGHPLHPMLVHFPIALWSLGTGCDALGYLGVAHAWPAAGLLQALGLAIAIPAMAAGFADMARLADDAVPTASRHMILMGSAWAIYLGAALAHLDGGALAPQPVAPLALVLSTVGFATMTVGAWHGGQLVYRFGAGVERTGAS